MLLPFQGEIINTPQFSQGVALGWYLLAFQAVNKQKKICNLSSTITTKHNRHECIGLFAADKDIKNNYLSIDETEVGYGNKIPLWMFRLLY